jgi:hypothetical protein
MPMVGQLTVASTRDVSQGYLMMAQPLSMQAEGFQLANNTKGATRGRLHVHFPTSTTQIADASQIISTQIL